MIHGAIAQLVEQRTENPCVPGSIPGGTTKNKFVERCKQIGLQRFLFVLGKNTNVMRSRNVWT